MRGLWRGMGGGGGRGWGGGIAVKIPHGTSGVDSQAHYFRRQKSSLARNDSSHCTARSGGRHSSNCNRVSHHVSHHTLTLSKTKCDNPAHLNSNTSSTQ